MAETYLEPQMLDSLNEMEKQREKILKLQHEKKEEEELKELELKKRNNIELNMSVMKNWLKKYNIKAEEDKIAKEQERQQQEQMNNYHNRGRGIGLWWHGAAIPIDLMSAERENKRLELEEKKIPLFNYTAQHIPPTPFMKEYIEATYTLFQLQQKRIEKLESIIYENLHK